MCGVFGYVGQRHDVGVLVGTALKRLEYRGYDSWGMAWEEAGTVRTAKETGRLNGSAPNGYYSRIGIGHTRWATHGKVTTANAHPHLDCTGRVAVVHNGIIENLDDLRASLRLEHRFTSETDSEVVVHLLEEEMRGSGQTLAEAVRIVFPRLEGFNAIVAIDARAGTMVAAKRTSPLLVGKSDGGHFIASDILAFAGVATDTAVIEDETLVQIDGAGMRLLAMAGGRELRLDFERLAAGVLHDEFPDEPGAHMRAEIAEQPRVIAEIAADITPVIGLAELARRASSIVVVGCGSALNAAEYGHYLLAGLGRNVTVLPASEIHHFAPLVDRATLVVAVSQSGETADVIDAMALARERGARVAAIVNAMHSTLARSVDRAVPLLAGTERSVLATKSFTAMLARFIQLAAVLSGDASAAHDALAQGAAAMQGGLDDQDQRIDEVCQEITVHEHVFVLGRGRTWPIAREAALKIQEGSYVHAQAFPGGELKHGPLALITEGIPCLAFPGEGEGARQLRANMQEVQCRGGRLIGIGACPGDMDAPFLATGLDGMAAGLAETVIAQRLAYRTALLRGINPDRPRNLAKSVTVK